jgi:hypothetical protein
LRSAFWKWYLPSAQREGWLAQLAPCFAPIRRSAETNDSTFLLERIALYQHLSGKKDPLPKSLRKLRDGDARRQREVEHLRALLAKGMLDAAARSRLEHLENADGTPPDAAKIRRAAEEAFLLSGIEAMEAVLRRLAEAECHQYLRELAAVLDRDRFWDFVLWIENMTDQERHRLRTVIASRSQHGARYKRYLADNKDWISKAIVRGVDLDRWFNSETYRESIGGRTMEIVVATELHDIFQMGDYFHTCLGLGGCNEMSVLSNASDANKQVVFMYVEDAAGQKQVVARQLIAISRDFKLLGYCCYMSWRHVDKAMHPIVLDAIASYCGRLAAHCNLELADQGSPEQIADHFWYDDGERDWPAAARIAWSAEKSERYEHRSWRHEPASTACEEMALA